MNEEKKSIKLNMILNAIKGLLSVIFSLITFPYASKVLGVDNIGRFNFANSIISYFVLLAGLGIGTYAIREGARIRNNYEEFKDFSNEIFTINILSTLVSYALFLILLFFIPKFKDYSVLLIILSSQIIFTTIGIEWIYSIYEDFLYITIRSIAFQLVSIALLFLLVRDDNSLNLYAIVSVFSNVGTNILNYYHSKKYCRISITRKMNLKKHLKPIMILFGMAITISIYVSSDTTILGFFCDDYTVGIYSVSVKIYTIIKTILSAVLVVSIPRLSSLLGEKKKYEFNEVASDVYQTLLTVVIPAIVGIIVLRKQIILLISNDSYIGASSSLLLLSIALFFCLGAWFWGQCVLLPLKQENSVFLVTVISACANIGLNFLLIPIWKENAAALTTVIAEGMSFAWCWYKGNKIVKVTNMFSALIKVVIGTVSIIIISSITSSFLNDGVLYVVITIISSIVVYTLIEIILKNKAVYSIYNIVKKKVFRSSGED